MDVKSQSSRRFVSSSPPFPHQLCAMHVVSHIKIMLNSPPPVSASFSNTPQMSILILVSWKLFSQPKIHFCSSDILQSKIITHQKVAKIFRNTPQNIFRSRLHPARAQAATWRSCRGAWTRTWAAAPTPTTCPPSARSVICSDTRN